MTKKELLTRYRTAVIELEELRHQLDRVGTDGRPSGCRTAQFDRAGSGTNDPNAAAMHLADGLEAMKHQKETELQQLGQQVEQLLKEIKDFRTYIVIQHYYLLARTDEQVARTISMSKSRVNQIRMGYLRSA